jgi:hypothetical protein
MLDVENIEIYCCAKTQIQIRRILGLAKMANVWI